MDRETADQFATELTEFTSLLRARLVGTLDNDNPPGHSPAEETWQRIYGRFAIDGRNLEEIGRKVGEMVHTKVNVACIVAALLAVDLAKQTGRTAVELVDELERDLIEKYGSPPEVP